VPPAAATAAAAAGTGISGRRLPVINDQMIGSVFGCRSNGRVTPFNNNSVEGCDAYPIV